MEDEDIDIQAAMGFTSFGGNKKRKHDQTNSPNAKADVTGANSTQLGVRSRKAVFTDGLAKSEASISTAASDLLHDPRTNHGTTGGTGLVDFLARGQSYPHQPTDSQMPQKANLGRLQETVSFGGPEVSKAELDALRFGVKTEQGDMAYFKPSFLEDPWGKLLQSER